MFFGKGGCVDCERNGTVCESVEYIVNKKRGVLDSSLCLCSIIRFLLFFGQGTPCPYMQMNFKSAYLSVMVGSLFMVSDRARLVPTPQLPLNPLQLEQGSPFPYGLIEAVALSISNIPFDVLRDVVAVFYAAYHVIVVTRLPSKINLN